MIVPRNDHWEYQKIDDLLNTEDGANIDWIPNVDYDKLTLMVLADICDNLTVIANILLNSSKGGK